MENIEGGMREKLRERGGAWLNEGEDGNKEAIKKDGKSVENVLMGGRE